jgi:prophage regulatory protein
MPEQPSLVSLNGVCEITSLSRTMINRLRAEGKFPRAVEAGDRRIAFVREEVHAWVKARISDRDSKAARPNSENGSES